MGETHMGVLGHLGCSANMRNHEEQITFEYLKSQFGKTVFPVPAHDDPPDIIVNSKIAVEVRRLNERYFQNQIPEGLENLSVPLSYAVEEVFRSFDHLYDCKSYWIGISYERPINKINLLKKRLMQALSDFLDSDRSTSEIIINSVPEFSLTIFETSPRYGRLFSFAGSSDEDEGGIPAQIYIKNIQYCIQEKTAKVITKLESFQEWQLYLVDSIGFNLDQQDISQIIHSIDTLGAFSEVVVLDYSGKNVIFKINKQNVNR